MAHNWHTKTARLGRAVFVHPQEEIVAARHLFLKAIETTCPEVLANLGEDVLPHYKADDDDIDDARLRWAKRFNLITHDNLTRGEVLPQWLESQVHITLRFWEQYEYTPRWHFLVPQQGMGIYGLPPHLDELKISLGGVGGSDETEAELMQRLIDEANSVIKEHRATIRTWAEQNGLKEPREVRRPEHFEWAVWFQIKGQRATEIAASVGDGFDDRSVRLAVAEVLRLIGIDKRRDRSGPARRSLGR